MKMSLNKRDILIMKIKCKICDKTVEVSENLTKQQTKILKFILQYYKEHKTTPTYRGIAEGLGYKSTSNIYYFIERLIDKQYISKRPYKARSLVILKEFPCG